MGTPPAKRAKGASSVDAVEPSGNAVDGVHPSAPAGLGPHHATFADFHEAYVRHYISLADTKAALLFGLLSSVIAFIYAKPGFHGLIFNPNLTWRVALAYAASLLLGSAALCSIMVIAPRGGPKSKGLVFFGEVSRFDDAASYVAAIQEKDSAGLIEARLMHSHAVSRVCWRKYGMLRKALWLAAIGFAALLPLLGGI